MKWNFIFYTLVKTTADRKRRGETDKMTSVNFHPFINPMLMPAMKAETDCIALPNLSPKPSLILLTSLDI